jgi:hypothetical protein
MRKTNCKFFTQMGEASSFFISHYRPLHKLGADEMVDFSKELKRLMEKHPVLSAVALTMWIWYASYRLGANVGEFVANIKN